MIEKVVNILLVEDDEVDIMNVKRAFKRNKIINPLNVARNGLEALHLLRGNKNEGIERLSPSPRVVLLDINMPKMNGLEFLEEIRNDEKFKTLSVFVMTTSDDDMDKLAAFKLNVAGYILKPLSFERFVEAISTLNSYWKLCEPL